MSTKKKPAPSSSGTSQLRFTATIKAAGKTATGILVPDEIVAQLGTSKRPAVHVTINGHTYRNTIASMGGVYMVGVSAEERKNTGVAAGDTVDVTLALDTEPRTVAVPADLAAALNDDTQAAAFFNTISYSNKRWYTLWIDSAKKVETRQARVSKAIEMLRAGRKQG
jgi:Bacteriocin-protection, YdeI or OmpD-Associated/Domain of unknown function (DUF1905)